MDPQSYTIGKAISPFLSDQVTYVVAPTGQTAYHKQLKIGKWITYTLNLKPLVV